MPSLTRSILRLIVYGALGIALVFGVPRVTAQTDPPSVATKIPVTPALRPVGRVWACHPVSSGGGLRGLSDSWAPGSRHDWRAEFGEVVNLYVKSFGPVGAAPGQSAGYDEVMIYRPFGYEDHAPGKPMTFDALPRARSRMEQLKGSPPADTLRRLVDADSFVEAARRAQELYGKPFWYYLGQCDDPVLEKKTFAELDAWVFDSAEPIISAGGNIMIDASGPRGADSTSWLVGQCLRRMGVKQVGFEPIAHTLFATNNAGLRGGSTQFTPWANDPTMVGLMTSTLFDARIPWRDPHGLTEAEVARNANAWCVPLELHAGEVVLWPIQKHHETVDWLADRLAEGYSVMVSPRLLQESRLTPAGLKQLAASRRGRAASTVPPSTSESAPAK